MTLKERITEDMKAAMRASDKERLSTIRMVQAAIKQREVDERIVLDDTAVVGIVDKGELFALGTQAELTRVVGGQETLRLHLTEEVDRAAEPSGTPARAGG